MAGWKLKKKKHRWTNFSSDVPHRWATEYFPVSFLGKMRRFCRVGRREEERGGWRKGRRIVAVSGSSNVFPP